MVSWKLSLREPATLKYAVVTCPLCNQRKARRLCPALGKQICPTCCGSKRLVEIQCPESCPYLASAREHPPAAALRRQQDDVGVLVRAMRDLNERQTRLFFLVASFLVDHQPMELHGLVDEDVVQAVDAQAATFETASRGVIYEHRPSSLPAERLANDLKPLLTEAGGQGGTAFQRDVAVVLRKVAGAARELGQGTEPNRRAFLELLKRVISKEKKPEARPTLIT